MRQYITEDKIADFVARMWNAGFCVEADPKDDKLTIRKDGKYHFIDVYRKGSYEELCSTFLADETVDKQEA